MRAGVVVVVLLLGTFFLTTNSAELTSLAASDLAFWSDTRNLLLLGVERLAQNDFREALPLLEEALRRQPGSALAHAWLANALHLQRRLDEAAVHYRALLELNPIVLLDEERRNTILRLTPKVFQVRSDPFELLDAVAIHHPEEALIAYHFFWQDDIDFPSDNDPCDHELVWVRYDPRSGKLSDFYTYFHGRILSSAAAVSEAAEHEGRPRVNIQWGKHGSLPSGWEALEIQPDTRDIERNYLDLNRPLTLKEYNLATYQKLYKEGRQDQAHPRTAEWPLRFKGSWDDFVRFEKEVDLRTYLARSNRLGMARWNNAALQQIFLPYNFRPKTEWPDRTDLSESLESQVERRVGGSQVLSGSEAVALRRAAGKTPDPFVKILQNRSAELPVPLPPAAVFQPETPRYPNLWIYGSVAHFPSYRAFIEFIEQLLRRQGYRSDEVDLNEGADLALSIEHLQPWNSVEKLRHAHDVHVRLFWRRLERQSQHQVRSTRGVLHGRFWRAAISVHYEVEHAHPLHADVEVCPYCGRTGEYGARTGNLVEQVHDPLGVELLVLGRLRGEAVSTAGGGKLRGLVDVLKLKESDYFLSRPARGDLNTAAVAAIIVRSTE